MTVYTSPTLVNVDANACVSSGDYCVAHPSFYWGRPVPGRLSQVPLPTWLMDKKWTESLDGTYVPKAAYELEKSPFSTMATATTPGRFKPWRMVCVQYGNDKAMQVPYMRVFIEEISSGKSAGKPFKRMKEMWSELHERKKSKSCFTVDDCGRMYDTLNRKLKDTLGWSDSADDFLEGIFEVAEAFEKMYISWRMFPNEKKMNDVAALVEAVTREERMRHESVAFESRIEDARTVIRETQNDIARMQGELNKLYEDSADAMNLLEEHGVDPNKFLDSPSPDVGDCYDLYSSPYIKVDGSLSPYITVGGDSSSISSAHLYGDKDLYAKSYNCNIQGA